MLFEPLISEAAKLVQEITGEKDVYVNDAAVQDKGVFNVGIIYKGIFPGNETYDEAEPNTSMGFAGDADDRSAEPKLPIEEATYEATAKAITGMYDAVQKRYGSYYDVINLESSVAQAMTLKEKQNLYQYQPPGSDRYPPHVLDIPPNAAVPTKDIFDSMRLRGTAALLIKVLPMKFLNWNSPIDSTMAGIEAKNKELIEKRLNIYTMPNIGERDDWYTDEQFAQQHFTGANPATIKALPDDLLAEFKLAATSQKDPMLEVIESATPGSLFVEDTRYFRDAVGVGPSDTISSSDAYWDKFFYGKRYGCAAVTLFKLFDDGKLHPLAIVIDYKGSMDKSVVIFNQRASPDASKKTEANDWPWRYAKTCAQVTDWTRHELTVHLTNTHLVEEASIVAINRCFDPKHIVFQILAPHWLKTLSLNSAARSILVPSVICNISGFKETQVYSFVQQAYNTFNWVDNYVPNDLEKRGFPVKNLRDDKFRNYPYGKNMYLMWSVLKKFVVAMLNTQYNGDDKAVADDLAVVNWTMEMQSEAGANMDSFPQIKTLDALADAVTMCIHLASPQHTAVNYLQDYYGVFIPNKPTSMMNPLPTKLSDLQKVQEKDLVAAFPGQFPRVWLLATHLPHLLSLIVADANNLVTYAQGVAESAGGREQKGIQAAGIQFLKDLGELTAVFLKNSEDMTVSPQPYRVMDPKVTAVSILI